MLVFSTKLPLKDTITQDECTMLFIKWVIDSPNYEISTIDYDIASHKDFDCCYEKQSFSIRHYSDEDIEISACRLENKDTDALWINDCIFLCENGTKFLLIQLYCNRTNFDTKLPHPHKPYIIRQFIEGGYCKDDAGIPVIDEPIQSDGEYYATCVDFMNGNLDCIMPIIYVSCDYWGNTALNPVYLARQLSGVAHVFVEKTRETALKLKDDTDGNNAHTEYVGIYFPGTKYCQKHSLRYYVDDKAMTKEIINSVWKVLINRSDSSKFNWNHILALQARQSMTEWKNISAKDKVQLQEYMDTFDQENQSLREQLEEMNAEVYSLRSQLDTMRMSLNSSQDNCFYKKGNEADLYIGETSDMLYSVLSQTQTKFAPDSRAYLLIESLLKANPKIGECQRVINGISSIFSGDCRLSKTDKAKLKNLGFSIEEEGPHYKMFFYDPQYMFTVSKTPSDHRDGKNLLAAIRNIIDVERKI